MILSCPVIVELWKEVNNWINEIGFINYKLSENRIILGDIENGITLTTIILLTKKVFYNSFKKETIPSIAHIKNETKKFFYLEKYDYFIKHKIHIFNKRWHLLNIHLKMF